MPRTHHINAEQDYKCEKAGAAMLWTVFIILLVLWLLGVVGSYTFGGLVHILLVLAVVALVVQLITNSSHPA